MSLVNELIKGLLPEEEKQITTAVYAGGFKPPTSGHFEVVKKALEENPEIDEFIIFIGAKERDGISQDESLLIWEIYNNYLPFKVKIEPTSIPPIKAVYNYAKDHPTREVLWIIGAREGNEEDFKDITSRTSSISKYPNLELRTIVTAGGVSGTAARNAAKVSFEKFEKFVPDILSPEEKQEAYNLVSGKIQEVGEANVFPYKWEETKKTKYSITYEFITDSGVDYLVKFTDNDDDEDITSLDQIRDWDISFFSKSKVDSDGAYAYSSSQVVNKGELFRVMSTIVDITKNVIKQYPNTKKLSFQPSPSKGDDTVDNQRGRLYKAFVSKQLPQAKVDQEGSTVTINLPEKISLNENKSDPKKGTGKKPKGSGRRLYTDEDPSDTVGVKFSTRQDIVDTLNKTSFKNKSHARQSQIINLIHQRVRAAYNRAKDPEVKKRLKTALDYAEKRKEASKAKTQRLKSQKENIDPKSQSQHKGKAAPYGSAYQKVKENIDGTFDKSQYYLEYYERLSPDNFDLNLSDNKIVIDISKQSLNENASYTTTIDITEKIAQLTNHMIKKGMNIEPLPTVEFIDDDIENAKNFLGKTAYYDPERKHIVLYTEGRHPKDIVRSYAHEMIHHIQNLEGRLGNVSTTNTMEDDHLNNLEAEANLKGTMTFRNWTDSIQESKKKDPFGLNAYAQELARLREIKYLNPNFDEEWKEAIRYPEFKEKGKNTWLKIAKQGYTINYSDIKNVLGNVNLNFKSLEEPKKQRFQSAFEKGTVEMPIAVKFSDSDYDLVAGNTRLSGLIKNGIDPKIWIIDISSLNEQETTQLDKSKVKIYLDMDGVLADFNQRFKSLAGMEPNEFESKYGKTAFWDFIDEGNNKIRFWVGIPVMSGAKELVDLASKYNYSVLTAPSAKKQSRLGKSLWIRNHTGDLFPSKPSVIFKRASEKHLVKPELTKNDILVDDKKSTIDNWNAAGGTGIFYKNISQVLNNLGKLGL